MTRNKYKILFAMSFVISILVLTVSAIGISEDLYVEESSSWRLQCYGQDLVDLVLITPCLMISALLMLKGRLIGRLTWPGIILYLIYTFVIYCFDVHFNYFFIEYCTVLGLSIYSLAYFLYGHRQTGKRDFQYSSKWIKAVAFYLMLTGGMFYFLWLSEILPAVLSHTSPNDLAKLNLATNPVHVLDLSFLLPLFIITAILLFRKRQLGLKLAASLLVFSVLMDATILVIDMLQEDNFIMRLIFIMLSLASLTLLSMLIRHYKKVNGNEKNILWKRSEL